MTQKVRTDWDISRPELRAAWERGDKGQFWPYGRRLREIFGEG